MRKSTLLKTMLLLCALVAGSSSVWAEDATITWNISGVKTTANGTAVNTTLNTSSVTGGSGTWTAVTTGNSYAGTNNNAAQLGSGSYAFNGTITLSGSSIPSNATIKSIGMTIKSSAGSGKPYSVSAKVNNTVFGSTQTVYNASNESSPKNYTFSGSVEGNNIVLSFSCESNKNVVISVLSVTYAVSNPHINASSSVNYAADITSGEIPYTISNPISGKTLNAESTDTWISNITVGVDKVTFEMEENTGAAREGKITLSYEGATSKDITINQAAAIAKHEVTIQTPENGTLVVQRSGVNVASGSMIPEGTILTVIATPNNGYRFQNWQYYTTKWNTRYTNNQEYEMPESDVIFRASFEEIPQYDYSWNVNGVSVKSETLYEGEDVIFPEVANLGGKTFMGWVTTSTVDPNEAPLFVNTSSVTASENTTYYAVFATATGSSTIKTDNLTTVTFGSPTTYTDWSGKSASNGSAAVYAGNSTTYNSSAIQIRSTNDNSGIVSTTSGGKAKKVTVSWNNSTQAGRTLNVYGKSTAYESAADLYGDEPGTLIGSIVKGTSTELAVSDNYEYIGLRSNSGAMYLDQISIEWEEGAVTYSDYTITIAPVSVTITTAKYATYCNATSDLDFSETGITAYTAALEGTSVKLTAISDGIVPANTGVILYSETADTYTVPVTSTSATISDNELVGVSEDTNVAYSDGEKYNYILQMDGTKPAFFKATGKKIRANRAYLSTTYDVTPANAPALSVIIDGENGNSETTEISQIANSQEPTANGQYYNLNGQRVAQPTKGLYIVNGKKIVVK